MCNRGSSNNTALQCLHAIPRDDKMVTVLTCSWFTEEERLALVLIGAGKEKERPKATPHDWMQVTVSAGGRSTCEETSTKVTLVRL